MLSCLDKVHFIWMCRSGSMSLRQVYFASLDLALHSEYKPGTGTSVFDSDIVKTVIKENTIIPPLPEDRFLNAFQHIFAGGYSAGKFQSFEQVYELSNFSEVEVEKDPNVKLLFWTNSLLGWLLAGEWPYRRCMLLVQLCPHKILYDDHQQRPGAGYTSSTIFQTVS